jgi:RNA polymerase sigma-70 factor (ECF subfamily)
MVLAAADPTSPGSAQALEALCSAYWYPLYAYVRRLGRSPEEAEDLTQAFFARVLEKQYLANVGPEKGRFRSFLLVCMKRFVLSEWASATTARRGGGRRPISIDIRDAEDRYLNEPASGLTPERAYERRWALTVLERSLAALAQEFAQRDRQELFDVLKVYLAAANSAPTYAQTAERLGMTEQAIKVAIHRLRERYRAKVEEEIAQTVEDPARIEEEIQQLFEALAS